MIYYYHACHIQHYNRSAMAQKHYHNDYKKLMGVDQSRTASEKLLDRAIRNRDPPSQIIDKLQREEPQKKVKRQVDQNKQINPDQVIDKIIKVLQSHTHLQKVQKSLQILQKCLTQKQFVSGLKIQKLQSIANYLINTKHFLRGSLGQIIKLSQLQYSVLETISSIIKDAKQQFEQLLLNVNIHRQMLALITDDSFSFAKNSQVLKTTIFNYFKLIKQHESSEKEKNKQTQAVVFIEQYILPKLMLLPNNNTDWSRNGIINLLKQFIVQYKGQLKQPKQLLAEYNKFMQDKKSSVNHQSADIMGKKVTSGGAYTAIQTHDSSGTWCKKQ